MSGRSLKFIITAPDGQEINGEFHSMSYCSLKGLYDKEWTEEQFEQWGCEDWENIMASIFRSRECDMDGNDGELSGFLFQPPSWASDDKPAGPKWRITAIKNGSERKYNSTWETWNWYDEAGKVIHIGDTKVSKQDVEKIRNAFPNIIFWHPHMSTEDKWVSHIRAQLKQTTGDLTQEDFDKV